MESILGDTASLDRLASPAASDIQARGKSHTTWRRKLATFTLLPLIGFAVFKGYDYWSVNQHYESTDDAVVDAHISQVGPQVSGRVKKIPIRDNEIVAAGQVLVEIDPSDYANRLVQARAQLATSIAQRKQIEAQLDMQRANIDQDAANLKGAKADDLQARQDQARYVTLSVNAVTRQQVDHGNASAASSTAKVEADEYALSAARAQLRATQAQLEAAIGSVDQAESQVENARLQLSYTTISAPVAGRITKRSVEVGNYVAPGGVMLSIVPEDVWVTANFKETQLAEMEPGQKVDIHVDAFPARHFKGHVDSFQTGTGSAFSALPAENATGNYVKITQRVPIKILFDDKPTATLRLAPGMSVEPKVEVR